MENVVFQGLLAQIETRKVKTLGIAKTIYCSSYNCISLQRRASAGVKLGQSMFAMYWQLKERALGVTGCAHSKVGCLCLIVGRGTRVQQAVHILRILLGWGATGRVVNVHILNWDQVGCTDA